MQKSPNPTTQNQETRGRESAARGTPPIQKKKKAPLGQNREQRQCSHPTRTRTRDKKQPPRPPTPTRQETRKPRTENERRRRETKKKQVREVTLRYEGTRRYGLKTQCVARSKSHKGNPKPQMGFGFPQRLRERKRERNVADETNRTEEEDGRIQPPNTGRVVKGSQEQKQKRRPLRKTNGFTKTRQKPEEPKQLPDKHHNNFPGEFTPQGGGAHGLPCLLLESHPRGPWYRGVRRPPHHGNRPQWRNTQTTCQTNR